MKTLKSYLLNVAVAMILVLTFVPMAFAVPIIWTDWTSATAGIRFCGRINRTIGVTYAGEVAWARLLEALIGDGRFTSTLYGKQCN